MPPELVLGNANYRAEMSGLAPAARHLHPHQRHRSRARRRGPLPRARGQWPLAVRRVLRGRESPPDAARVLRPDEGRAGAAGLRLRPPAAREAVRGGTPEGVLDPQVVLLSPGVFNSAYFEHVFLAREMGVPLVEGRDLVVENDRVYMRTVAGPVQVDVIYRRLNDDFLDPEAFNPESMLGVAGLMRAYRKGTVALANAIGTGVADDKAVYAYVPRLIRYYLDRGPDHRQCRDADLPRAGCAGLYARPSGRAGGQAGRRIGRLRHHDRAARDQGRDGAGPRAAAGRSRQLHQPADDRPVRGADPDRGCGRAPPRRPAAVRGHRPRRTWVLPGGLSRVALKRGSLVVNSSQGGGSKDTWVLAERAGMTRLLSRSAENLFWLARYIERDGKSRPHPRRPGDLRPRQRRRAGLASGPGDQRRRRGVLQAPRRGRQRHRAALLRHRRGPTRPRSSPPSTPRARTPAPCAR